MHWIQRQLFPLLLLQSRIYGSANVSHNKISYRKSQNSGTVMQEILKAAHFVTNLYFIPIVIKYVQFLSSESCSHFRGCQRNDTYFLFFTSICYFDDESLLNLITAEIHQFTSSILTSERSITLVSRTDL